MKMFSDSISNIIPAIQAIQKQLVGIQKDGKNPHFKNTYASLNAIVLTLREHIDKQGLFISQTSTFTEGENVLRCTIHHIKSGEYMQGDFPLVTKAKDPQQLGSSISYMRRYSILTMFGLLVADDDAELAAGREPEPKKQHKVEKNFEDEQIGKGRASTLKSKLIDFGYDTDPKLKQLVAYALKKDMGTDLSILHETEATKVYRAAESLYKQGESVPA